jgi:hypothetical protein
MTPVCAMRVNVGVWIGPPTVSAWAKPASSSITISTFGASPAR